MSITGFDDAIRDNVNSYSANLDTLRENNVRQRNNALAGLQSEVEKYGEMAKLGLEIPVAVEGLKQVGKRAGDLVNFVKGAPERLREARGAVDTALSRGRELYEGGIERAGGAVDNIRENMLGQRLDNLRRSSALDYGGESKVEFNPIERVRETAIRGRTGIEMNEMPASAQGDFSYSHSEVPRGGGVAAEDMVGNVDEYGLPRVSSSVTESSEPSLFSHEEPRFSTSRPLDAGFANDRVSIANMGRPSRAPAARPYSRPEPQGEMKEMDNFAPKEEGEIRPGSSVSRTTRNTFGGDIEQTADSAEQAAATEAADATGIEGLGDAAAAAGAGEAAGAVEEAAGAGLLASGIFAPLGALLEGIGAVTEVGSVGAGVYGAVQSFSEEAQAQALRKAPLPQVSQPTLDLGGRVAAPVLA